MKHEDWNDERLANLLAATRAERDPRTLERALERIRTREQEVPGWLEWATRPVALAASCGLLIASLAVGGLLLRGSEPASASSSTDVLTTLIGEDASLGLEADAASPSTPVAPGDSGASL